MKLSRFDVLLYLEEYEDREGLFKAIRQNALYRRLSERTISRRLEELIKDNLITKYLELNEDNPGLWNLLAFLHWGRLRGKDYNKPLINKSCKIFGRILAEGGVKLSKLSRNTRLSKPTVSKYLGILEESNLMERVREKPLKLSVRFNDLTFFYVNFLGYDLDSYAREFRIPGMRKIQSKKLREKLIELHTYSTTVTEGNTATEEDVERIFNNYPVDLTPREIAEILTARGAIEYLYKNRNEEITIREIKNLHEILMKWLVERPGRFHYGRKRIIGSETKLPQSKDEIRSALKAMLNFHHEYKGEIDARVLGAIIHFIFVMIHPFVDGNGRVARLLHSWILLKEDMPIFVFDPNQKNEYFELLEKGREDSIDGFIEFCLREHARVLKRLTP